MIPMIMKLRVRSGRFRVKLWIPLILIWLLLLVPALILLPFVAIAWTVLALRGLRIPMLQILSILFELLGGLRETEIHVDRPASVASVDISMI